MKKLIASDVAFTPSVKAAQEQRGSRAAYRRMEEGHGWRTAISEELAGYLAERDSIYLATTNAEGQPYVQHRGGPKGFVRVLDEHTLAFADFAGNRQYITLGNLADNDRAFIFAMDYAARRRIKIWGRARVVEGDAELAREVTPPELTDSRLANKVERVILFEVSAWDINCPQYIPRKLDAELVEEGVTALRERIRELEEENAGLRAAASGQR